MCRSDARTCRRGARRPRAAETMLPEREHRRQDEMRTGGIADGEEPRRVMAEAPRPIRAAHGRDDGERIVERRGPGMLRRAAIMHAEDRHGARVRDGADDMVMGVEIAEGVAAAVAVEDAGRARRHAERHGDLHKDLAASARRREDLDAGDRCAGLGDRGEIGLVDRRAASTPWIAGSSWVRPRSASASKMATMAGSRAAFARPSCSSQRAHIGDDQSRAIASRLARRPSRYSTSCFARPERPAAGLRCASDVSRPRRISTYLRTARPTPGCCS